MANAELDAAVADITPSTSPSLPLPTDSKSPAKENTSITSTNTVTPDTTPGNTAVNTIAAAASSDAAPETPKMLDYYKKVDSSIAHFNRLCRTSSGLSTTYQTLYYTLLLTSTHLARLSRLRVPPLNTTLTKTAVLIPGDIPLLATIVSASRPSIFLLRTSRQLRALADLISDHRNFGRLFGLLGIYAWGMSVWRSPPRDSVLKFIAWCQVLSNVFYQYLENMAYLSGHSVVRLSKSKRSKYWAWSSRFWFAHIILDFGRLIREKQLRAQEEEQWKKQEAGETKERGPKSKEIKAEQARWRLQTWCNAANLPLSVHWSSETGILNDETIGLLGSVVGLLGFREAWRATAA